MEYEICDIEVNDKLSVWGENHFLSTGWTECHEESFYAMRDNLSFRVNPTDFVYFGHLSVLHMNLLFHWFPQGDHVDDF